VLYWARIPAVERYKINPKPWPWLQGPEQRRSFFGLVRLGIGMTLLNLFIAVGLAILNYPIFAALGFTAAVDRWPSAWTLMWQLALFIVAEDAVFYFTHRTLHVVPWLYRHVHKLHHRYFHSISIAAECTHPFEFILGK
jgi:sterol desaturase/sphingolipid hydroxylase (fatty acid hydroxylase superfamily)